MRAIVIRRFGGPDVVEVAEVPLPQPGPGQVRVRVAAAGVNPVDLAVREGLLTRSGLIPEADVYGLGWDLAGTVDATGPGVTGFPVGLPVAGLYMHPDAPLGAQAEYAVLDAPALAPVPDGMDLALAATVPLNALTADQSLDLLDLPPGATLVITGAAGAVGRYATALAAGRGLHVVGVAGADDEPAVRAAGARDFVARGAGWRDRLGEVLPDGVADAVFDPAVIGEEAVAATRPGGRYLGVVTAVLPPSRTNRWVAGVLVRPDGPRLAELLDQVAAGRLSTHVADRYPLEEAGAAQTRLAKGGVRGRLVLVP